MANDASFGGYHKPKSRGLQIVWTEMLRQFRMHILPGLQPRTRYREERQFRSFFWDNALRRMAADQSVRTLHRDYLLTLALDAQMFDDDSL
jgi:hypothetical protein